MFSVRILLFSVFASLCNREVIALTINIGLLVNANYSDVVVQLAYKKLISDGTIPNSTIFKTFPIDSCVTYNAIDFVVQSYHSNSINVILGPPCSTQMDPIGQLAGAWNIPIIGYLSNDEKFADKTTYDTLARTALLSSNYVGQAISMLLTYYNWKQVALITSSDASSQIFRNGIVQAFAIYDIMINLEMTVNQTLTAENFTEQGVYDQIKAKARIVVFIMGTDISYAIEFLKGAQQANMTGLGSEYVFFTAWLDNSDTFTKLAWQNDDLSVNASILNLYHGVLAMHVRGLEPQVLQNFSDWFANQTDGLTSNPRYLMPLFDAVCLYGIALQKSIKDVGSLTASAINNGTQLWSYMRNQDFQCSSVPVLTNNVADRLSSYGVYRIRADREQNDDGYFELIMYLEAFKKPDCNHSSDSVWADCFDLNISQYTSLPKILDEPLCGFKDEKCNHSLLFIGIAFAATTIMFLIVAAITYRQYRLKKGFLTPWHIPREMIKTLDLVKATEGSVLSLITSNTSLSTNDHGKIDPARRANIGNNHAVIKVYSQTTNITFQPRQLTQLYQLKQLNHENLNSFIGLSYNEQNELVVCWNYCSRGSLEDTLHASEMELDEAFKASFIKDVIAGLQYLHSSNIAYHGMLSSATCLIDSRWTVKLSNYGLQSMLTDFDANKVLADSTNSKMKTERKLYMAPEHLRKLLMSDTFTGSQEGDVYSLGLLMLEILCRKEPFSDFPLTPADVVDRLANPNGSVLRPKFDQGHGFDSYLTNMVQLCWDEHPINRPLLKQVHRVVERSLTCSKGSLVDQMMKRMEKYAANLERIVKDRTSMLEEAREQADNLLSQLLPRSVAEDLKHGRHVEPQTYELATVLFSDIVGFTQLCSDSLPLQVVTFLNDMFSGFDQIIASHDAYKVETIGDAYLIVSGVPHQNGMRNVVEIAEIALKMRHQMDNFVVAHRPHIQMKIRIGFHSGSVAAGVIGLAAPRYCLFGDTVNMASRMESTGEAGEIQLSDKSHALLQRWPEFQAQSRGFIEVKGKGKCETFWLRGKTVQ